MTVETIVFLDNLYMQTAAIGEPDTTKVLDKMTLSELASLFNLVASNLDRGSIKKFADRQAAVRRTWAILTDYHAEEDAPSSEGNDVGADEPEQVPAHRANAVDVPRKTGGVNFLGMRSDIRASKSGQVALTKSGSIRSEALELLQREGGADEGQLEALFHKHDAARGSKSGKPTRQRIYEMVRIFCYHYGYGTVSTEGGQRIRLVVE